MKGKKVGFFGFQMNIFNMFIVFGILFLCLSVILAAPFPEPEEGIPICTETRICGQIFLDPKTGNPGFYFKTWCDCSPGTVCMRSDDPPEEGFRYKYYCRVNKSTEE